MSDIYNADFFAKGERGMIRSARAIVPVLYEMFKPQSVIDVGCGEGWWLREFAQLGVKRLVGVEPNVDSIAAGQHVKLNLQQSFDIPEKYGLCLCLEVAEHLAPESAIVLVDNLCRLSSTVVFSAAIPKQGGNGHLNERWPSYWARLFNQRDYGANDHLRRIFWGNANVEPWYVQNMLIYQREATGKMQGIMDIVHPELWAIYRGK